MKDELAANVDQLITNLVADYSERIICGESVSVQGYLDKLPNEAARQSFMALASMSCTIATVATVARSEPLETAPTNQAVREEVLAASAESPFPDERQTTPVLFLCHSHEDKEFARKLAQSLSDLAINVWFDEWELTPGDSLHECIGKALLESAYIGVLLTPASVQSRWCQSELQQGLAMEKRLNKKVVLPLLCHQVQPPPFLEDRLYVDFDRDYWKGLAELAGFIKNVDLRLLRMEMERSELRSSEDVLKVIQQAGVDILRYVKSKDYRRLQRLLEEYGVSVPTDRFLLIPKRSRSDDEDGPFQISAVQC